MSRLTWPSGAVSLLRCSAILVAICLAVRSSATTSRRSPACGTSGNPSKLTGVLGGAFWMRLPRSLNIARTLPAMEPTTILSPILSVPCWMSTVAVGPVFFSSFASMITPVAGRLGLARISCTSATSKIISSRSSMPVPLRAETGTQITSPPYSSITTPMSYSCCLTKSGLASGLSILFSAIMMGTLAA